MKRTVLLLFTIIATVLTFANTQGHFFLNVKSDNVQVANVESHFAQWLNLPANTTFTLFRDETDNLGIRHLSYQQSVSGIEVSNAIVLVHAKNGIVYVVNGDIMDVTIAAQQLSKLITPLKAAQKVRKQGNSSDAQIKIIRTTINGKELFRYAYEVITENHFQKQYIDAETGEIIKTVSLIYNADVSATATTMYNGTQPITCHEKDGLYYLRDEGRGIVTLNATNMYNPDDEDRLEHILRQPDSLISTALYAYFNDCEEITNPTTTWGGNWKKLLKTITIDAVAQNSNWYSIGEGTADIYIKIKDCTGGVVFTTSRLDDPKFPVTFNIGIQVTTPPYSIEVWDYDPLSSDDLIETITLETIRGENKTYDFYDFKKIPTIVELTCRIESSGRQPFLDAHWGMEKTVDFYREKFNRNSYDNQGSIVYQLVNQPSTVVGLLDNIYANACALGDQNPILMIYGMGMISSNSEYMSDSSNPFVSVDIMAHEFSHLVTDRNGNGGLEYIGESGALNESFSDIMGMSVLKYATGYTDWLIASDIMIYVSNLRSMDNPNNGKDGHKPQPDTYGGLYWVDPQDKYADQGGVHTNSGVQNHWFYLLTEGGSGTNDINNAFNVTGIGIEKAVQIAYRNLIYYLTPEATHEDSRNGSIQAAIDLYGKYSQEHQSVVNAWYAVGVGEQYNGVICKDVPYSEPFTSSMGDFDIQIVSKDAGLGTVWKLDASANQYGMVAKSMYNNVHYASEGWLISPHIEIPEDATTTLTFNHAAKFFSSANTEMTLWVSTDYESGKPSTATWTQLTIPRYPSGTNWTFVNSGNIDLSAYAGNCVNFAFKYVSTSTVSPQWEIKNVSVTSVPNPISGIDEIEQVPKSARKILRNGQLLILREGKAYDLTGKSL